MPDYKPVTQSGFTPLRWKRFDSYSFAAQDMVAPLVLHELPRACMTLPIAFVRDGSDFLPVALQGLSAQTNLFVAPDGRWIGPYTPAAYRSYPFTLARTETEQMVLCVDMESGLVGEGEAEDFFDDQGSPAPAVQEIVDFLTQVQNNRQATKSLCALLEREAILTPWKITVKGREGEQVLDGLWRVDEERFNALPPDALARLRDGGALPVIFCQLLSMQHIQTLGKLAESRAEVSLDDPDVKSLFGDYDDDTLHFDIN